MLLLAALAATAAGASPVLPQHKVAAVQVHKALRHGLKQPEDQRNDEDVLESADDVDNETWHLKFEATETEITHLQHVLKTLKAAAAKKGDVMEQAIQGIRAEQQGVAGTLKQEITKASEDTHSTGDKLQEILTSVNTTRQQMQHLRAKRAQIEARWSQAVAATMTAESALHRAQHAIQDTMAQADAENKRASQTSALATETETEMQHTELQSKRIRAAMEQDAKDAVNRRAALDGMAQKLKEDTAALVMAKREVAQKIQAAQSDRSKVKALSEHLSSVESEIAQKERDLEQVAAERESADRVRQAEKVAQQQALRELQSKHAKLEKVARVTGEEASSLDQKRKKFQEVADKAQQMEKWIEGLLKTTENKNHELKEEIDNLPKMESAARAEVGMEKKRLQTIKIEEKNISSTRDSQVAAAEAAERKAAKTLIAKNQDLRRSYDEDEARISQLEAVLQEAPPAQAQPSPATASAKEGGSAQPEPVHGSLEDQEKALLKTESSQVPIGNGMEVERVEEADVVEPTSDEVPISQG